MPLAGLFTRKKILSPRSSTRKSIQIHFDRPQEEESSVSRRLKINPCTKTTFFFTFKCEKMLSRKTTKTSRALETEISGECRNQKKQNLASGWQRISHICDHFSASTIKICSRNDPNVAKCILDSVRDLQPRLASGVLAPDFRIPVREDFAGVRSWLVMCLDRFRDSNL